jgi:hypothetical protein
VVCPAASVALALALAGATATVTGCGQTEVVQPPPRTAAAFPAPPKAPAPAPRPYRPGETPVLLGDEPDQAVDVSLERGVLNQGQVDDVLAGHTSRLSACYDEAGDAQFYAHGEVRLRFHVSAEGDVTDVLVIDNELGNYAVERCLIAQGRTIKFPRPGGDRASDFEYSLDFRSPRQKYVVIWRRGTLRRPIAAKLGTLGRCGSPGEQPVQAVAYIKPNGWVASVGLASEGSLQTTAAKCLVDQIMRWRLRGSRGHMVRTSFAVNGAARASKAAYGPTARLKRPPRRVRHD